MARHWQRRIRRTMRDAGLPLFIAAFILLLPVILPVAFIWGARYEKRKLATARRFRCAGCGLELGEDAVHLADTEWAAYMSRVHDEHPGYRFRIIRWFHAICGNCGLRYHYDERMDTFSPAGTPSYVSEPFTRG